MCRPADCRCHSSTVKPNNHDRSPSDLHKRLPERPIELFGDLVPSAMDLDRSGHALLVRLVLHPHAHPIDGYWTDGPTSQCKCQPCPGDAVSLVDLIQLRFRRENHLSTREYLRRDIISPREYLRRLDLWQGDYGDEDAPDVGPVQQHAPVTHGSTTRRISTETEIPYEDLVQVDEASRWYDANGLPPLPAAYGHLRDPAFRHAYIRDALIVRTRDLAGNTPTTYTHRSENRTTERPSARYSQGYEVRRLSRGTGVVPTAAEQEVLRSWALAAETLTPRMAAEYLSTV